MLVVSCVYRVYVYESLRQNKIRSTNGPLNTTQTVDLRVTTRKPTVTCREPKRSGRKLTEIPQIPEISRRVTGIVGGVAAVESAGREGKMEGVGKGGGRGAVAAVLMIRKVQSQVQSQVCVHDFCSWEFSI